MALTIATLPEILRESENFHMESCLASAGCSLDRRLISGRLSSRNIAVRDGTLSSQISNLAPKQSSVIYSSPPPPHVSRGALAGIKLSQSGERPDLIARAERSAANSHHEMSLGSGRVFCNEPTSLRDLRSDRIGILREIWPQRSAVALSQYLRIFG